MHTVNKRSCKPIQLVKSNCVNGDVPCCDMCSVMKTLLRALIEELSRYRDMKRCDNCACNDIGNE